jgi:hypothetical protein
MKSDMPPCHSLTGMAIGEGEENVQLLGYAAAGV